MGRSGSKRKLISKTEARTKQDPFEKTKQRGLDQETINRQKITNVKVKDLMKFKEFERGVRTNPTSYQEELIKDISKNGIINPIILTYNPNTGVAYISEGNHRLEVAALLGIKEVPVRINSDITANPSSAGLGGSIPTDPKTLEEIQEINQLETISASDLGFETSKTTPIEPLDQSLDQKKPANTNQAKEKIVGKASCGGKECYIYELTDQDGNKTRRESHSVLICPNH